MVITRTPYRISFFGGGTDYPEWYEEHGGSVLVTTINKYCYLTCRYLPPFFEHKYRVVYSKTELVDSVERIEHPAVRECIKFIGLKHGLEIHHDGDLPKQSGLGTSSSFVVGLLLALHSLKGEMVGSEQLAREAIHVERQLCHEAVGSQDQTAAAYGGFNHIEFGAGGAIRVRPVILPHERLELLQDHVMLFFTGISRFASVVAEKQIRNMKNKAGELSAMHAMVSEAIQVLTGGADIRKFGELLHKSWCIKRSLADGISTDEVDAMYNTAIRAGAIGGKICGAGGGGFLMLFVEPNRRADVHRALSRYLCVPIRFESEGAKVIFYQAEQPAP